MNNVMRFLLTVFVQSRSIMNMFSMNHSPYPCSPTAPPSSPPSPPTRLPASTSIEKCLPHHHQAPNRIATDKSTIPHPSQPPLSQNVTNQPQPAPARQQCPTLQTPHQQRPRSSRPHRSWSRNCLQKRRRRREGASSRRGMMSIGLFLYLLLLGTRGGG